MIRQYLLAPSSLAEFLISYCGPPLVPRRTSWNFIPMKSNLAFTVRYKAENLDK